MEHHDSLHETLRQQLRTHSLGRGTLRCLNATGSTNDDARALLGEHGALVVAERQTQGRGTRGRAWVSPESEGGDIYASVVLHQPAGPGLQLLSLAVGLAIRAAIFEALSHHAPFARGLGHIEHPDAPKVMIKWPNDVWLVPRVGVASPAKCAGVLVEGTIHGGVCKMVVGFGVNVNRTDFAGVDGRATSIKDALLQLSGHDGRARWSQDDVVPRAALLADILLGIEEQSQAIAQPAHLSALVESINEVLLYRGQSVTIEETRGVLIGIAPDGAAQLETDAGVKSLYAGWLSA